MKRQTTVEVAVWLAAAFALLGATTSARADGGDFSVDFAASEPYSYDHGTGGGDFTNVVESLQGGDFACGDIVTFLAKVTVNGGATVAQTIELDFSFLAVSTGQPGVGLRDIVYVGVNYGDPTIVGDDGSLATLKTEALVGDTYNTDGLMVTGELVGTVEITDLEAGEVVVLRVDARIICDPDTNPTGNLQGALTDGRVVAPEAEVSAISTGEQTIPFQKVGDILFPLLEVDKKVSLPGAATPVDYLEVPHNTTVKYWYTVTNAGSGALYDVLLVDDNGTPADTSDDYPITLTGLTDEDGDTLADDLAAGATATGEALATLENPDRTDVSLTVVNTAEASGVSSLGDPLIDSDTATVLVGPLGNTNPDAVDDYYTATEDTPLTVSAPGVLGNDTDPEGDTLTVTGITSGPSHGTVTPWSSDGSFTYTPTADYCGSDSFVYAISDGYGGTDTATVHITIECVNDPPNAVDDSATTDEDTPVVVDVLANDTDPDGDALTVTDVSDPADGTATINPDGTVTYEPDPDFCGTDSFTYTISDGNGGTDTATVNITVECVNDPPVAVDDAYTTNEDTPLNVAAPGILGNDSDVDGDTLTAALLTGPTNGTLALNADGSFTYDPAEDFCGTDSYTYTVSDSNGGTDTATVTITVVCVNDPPVANDDSATTNEDTAVTIDVLANDTDVEGDPLTVVSNTSPSHGSVVLNADGTFTYTPTANYCGPDSFKYTITDGYAPDSTDSATVTIDVICVNDDPVAVDDAYSTDEDTPLTVSKPGVLDNDYDVDGDSLTVTGNTEPTNGSVVQNADGSLTYTPNLNFNGTDSYQYTISDGNGGTDTATVTITVNPINDPPVAVDDAYSTPQDTPLSIDAPGVLSNDSDVDGDPISVTTYDAVSQFGGTVVANADGSFSYTPAAGFAGFDTFEYTITDGEYEDTATVTITVEAQNNRSISVDLYTWAFDADQYLYGAFTITNESEGYPAQIIDMKIEVEWKYPDDKKWKSVDVVEGSCTFDPSAPFVLADRETVDVVFMGCELAKEIPDGAYIRVTAGARVFGRFKGAKQTGWFYESLSSLELP